ncbi:MAG: nicotinamide-nucleotide amidase [Candidatus Polarisedimenticolaceae bacterium]|nr:nicotinamide-nucleotide amidase [Candidatus Polarisedimenticolaceae bacterium]
MDSQFIKAVRQLAALLESRQQVLAVAESCTGGWVAKVLTDLPGCSAWFDRGFVTYTNEAKHQMLGVSMKTIDTFGAVSEETVHEMALGVLDNSPAQFSLAVSGIAGPSGATAGKPVGTVWFGWAIRDDRVVAECCCFEGDREAVRAQAVAYALRRLIEIVSAVE